MKKILCIVLSLVFALGICVTAFAVIPDNEKLNERFYDGIGPEVNGRRIDYVAFSPVKRNDKTKYPLVIWFHGMGDGESPRYQLERSNISTWSSYQMQTRFKGTKGAYIMALRSPEEDKLYWTDELILPAKAAIDNFIRLNSSHIDLSRIYVGGYSMGGKMTVKMASMYPDFFAAAFPLCPAINADENTVSKLADMPVWISASKYDVIAGYNTYTKDIWAKLVAVTNRPEDCRLSVFGRVCYPDGKYTPSNHYVWFAANNDFFTYDNEDYYNMTTCDATGYIIDLEYPDGLISWLSSFRSENCKITYEPTDAFATEKEGFFDTFSLDMLFRLIKAVLLEPVEFFKEAFDNYLVK